MKKGIVITNVELKSRYSIDLNNKKYYAIIFAIAIMARGLYDIWRKSEEGTVTVGVSQEKFAAKLGVSFSSVNRWEK